MTSGAVTTLLNAVHGYSGGVTTAFNVERVSGNRTVPLDGRTFTATTILRVGGALSVIPATTTIICSGGHTESVSLACTFPEAAEKIPLCLGGVQASPYA